MMRNKLAAVCAALALWPVAAHAGSGTITVQDASGTTRTYAIVTNGPGQFVGMGVICDWNAAANCAGVNSGHEVAESVANGSDIALGATTDSAYAGTGNASVVATLKGIYTAAIAPLPTGSNVIGGVTVANGSDIALGATTDSIYAGTGNASVVAALKGIYSAVVSSAGAGGGPLPAGSQIIGYTSNDPCMYLNKFGAPINQTGTTQIILGGIGKRTYICSIQLVTAPAQQVSLIEGTGTNCATNAYGLVGGVSASTGWNFTANGGLTQGDGNGTVISALNDPFGVGANLCLVTNGAGQLSGHLSYVQQ